MAYVPFTKLPQQFFDNLGNPLVNGTINAYLAGTSTPTNMFSDDTGTVAGTSVTLDSRGEPTTFKLIWLDSTKNYKFILKDSTGSTIWTIDDIVAGVDASDVNYTPAGTNAVTTNVQTKLRETVSVKDFGAVGDGIADDWAAINNAINSGARSIYFPAGTYYCTKALLLYSKVKLYGDTGFQSGFSPSILQFADTTCGIVVHRFNTTCDAFGYNQTTTGTTSEGADGSVIEHLYIRRGNGADTTIDGVTHGIRLRARAHVDSCYISGFAGDGIHILATSGSGTPANEGNANNWGISNTRIQNCRDGVFVDGADVNVGMGHHVDSSSNNRYGIYDSSFLGCNWIGCHCNGNTTKDILQDSANGRSVFIGQYVETGGSSEIVTPAVAIGGLWGGGLTGGYQWVDGNLSGTTLAFTGNGSTTQQALTGTARLQNTWNQGSISTSRRASYNIQVGLTSNYMPIGSVLGRGGASNSYTAGAIGFEIYDGSASTTVAITGVTQANPGVITTGSAHGLSVNDRIVILSVGGMTQLNGTYLVNTTPLSTTFTVKLLDGTVVDTTAFTAYTAGGTVGIANGYSTAIEARGSVKDIVPGADNVWDLGDAALRYKEVFAVAPAINTSDAREKQQVRELSDSERAVAMRLKGLVRAYKFNDAVEAKGNSARIHVGVIAQDVHAAFAAEGLNGFDYSVLCYDEWDAEVDEDNNVLMPAGNRYGVRYGELLAFIIAVL